MKRFVSSFFCLLFLIILWQTTAFSLASQQEIEQDILKVKNEIKRLETKQAETDSASKKEIFEQMIVGHQSRLNKLVNQLQELRKSKQELVPLIEAPTQEEELELMEQKTDLEEERATKFNLEIGTLTGFFAGATAIAGEVRWPLTYVFGPAASCLRAAGTFAQSRDISRRYVVVQLDGVLKFPAGVLTGVENYLGLGINYVALTSGKVAGSWGTEIFYGVESEGFGGKVFGEMGLASLVTGFSPDHNGATILVGYRRDWSF